MSESGAWRRGRRAAVGGLLVVALALLATACGSSDRNTTTSSGSTKTGPNNAITTAFEYSHCMRSHGVTSFPDPKVTTSPGRQSIAFQVDPSETGSPYFKTASRACRSILPAPTGSIASQQLAHKQDMLSFARCVRGQGIAGFPDPDLQGRLTIPMIAAAGIDIRSRTVLDAAKACVGASHGVISLADVEAAANGAQ